jgi:hypothetical protein
VVHINVVTQANRLLIFAGVLVDIREADVAEVLEAL